MAAQLNGIDHDIAQWEPVVRKLAKKMGGRTGFDDAYSDGLEGAWEALQSHDPGKLSLTKWVFCLVRRFIANGIRRRLGRQGQKILSTVSIYSERYDGKDWANLLRDRRQPPNHYWFMRDALVYLAQGLTQKEKHILWLYFGEGYLYREIARSHGFTESRVSQIVAVAIDKIRKRVETNSNEAILSCSRMRD